METPEILEKRIADIIKQGAKKTRRGNICGNIYRAIAIAATSAAAIVAWEILLKGVKVVAAAF